MATRWAQANRTANYYVVLKVFGGYRQCVDQPQGWHQYADGLDIQQGYSAIASPGFWKNDAATPSVPPRSGPIPQRRHHGGHLKGAVPAHHLVQRMGRGHCRGVGHRLGQRERPRRVRRHPPRRFRGTSPLTLQRGVLFSGPKNARRVGGRFGRCFHVLGQMGPWLAASPTKGPYC